MIIPLVNGPESEWEVGTNCLLFKLSLGLTVNFTLVNLSKPSLDIFAKEHCGRSFCPNPFIYGRCLFLATRCFFTDIREGISGFSTKYHDIKSKDTTASLGKAFMPKNYASWDRVKLQLSSLKGHSHEKSGEIIALNNCLCIN
jgi:hypothetical protein